MDAIGGYCMSDTLLCPACSEEWPADRFNGKDAECFRCRCRTVGVNFGPAGKAHWHNTTNKEVIDTTISMSRANGLDPVPVHSASVSVAGSTLKKLEARSGVPQK